MKKEIKKSTEKNNSSICCYKHEEKKTLKTKLEFEKPIGNKMQKKYGSCLYEQ